MARDPGDVFSGKLEVTAKISCSICISPAPNPVHADQCLHIFCYRCTDTWMNISKTCPLCRKVVEFPIQCATGEALDFTTDKYEPVNRVKRERGETIKALAFWRWALHSNMDFSASHRRKAWSQVKTFTDEVEHLALDYVHSLLSYYEVAVGMTFNDLFEIKEEIALLRRELVAVHLGRECWDKAERIPVFERLARLQFNVDAEYFLPAGKKGVIFG
jgi:hypothetical protein